MRNVPRDRILKLLKFVRNPTEEGLRPKDSQRTEILREPGLEGSIINGNENRADRQNNKK